MDVVAAALAAAETPGVGPEELYDYWPVVRRLGWFLAGFLGVFLVGWFVVEPTVSRFVRQRNRNNPTIREVITRYVRLVVILAALAVGVGASGYGYIIGDSLLVVAAATLAVGVAGQTVLGSLVSGVVLVMDPEFNVGDYIEWSGGEGRIQSITLRVTRVVTPDGEAITVPNTTLTGDTISRPYGRSRYRLVDRIGVPYEADIGEALEHLHAAAAELDEVAEEPSPQVYVDEFSPDWVTCRVHYWIRDPHRQEVFQARSAYSKAVKERMDEADISISPPAKRDLLGHVEVEEPS